MNNEILQLGNILGCLLQPLYLCLFTFFVKKISKKRILFVIIAILDYFIIQNILKFNLGINGDLIYLILFHINLKFLYKEKCRVTDIVTYTLSLFIMGISNILFTLLFGFKIITIIVSNMVLIGITILMKNKLTKIEKFYNKFWNRHNLKFLKSVTIRGISATLTIITFVILHIWLIYGIL